MGHLPAKARHMPPSLSAIVKSVYYYWCTGMVEGQWFKNWRSVLCARLFWTAIQRGGRERKRTFIKYDVLVCRCMLLLVCVCL